MPSHFAREAPAPSARVPDQPAGPEPKAQGEPPLLAELVLLALKLAFVVGFVAMGVINGAIITNAVSSFTSVTVAGTAVVTGGHDTQWAGNVWAFYLFCVIICKISLGAIYDRFGLRPATLLGTATCLAAAVFLCFPTTDWGPILACLTFSFGTCMGTVCPPVMAVREFGKKDLGTVTGIITAFELFGSALGAVVSGLLFDAFYSFNPAWIMAFACSLVMGAALYASIGMARRLAERHAATGNDSAAG